MRNKKYTLIIVSLIIFSFTLSGAVFAQSLSVEKDINLGGTKKILNALNVGIGTASPETSLDVRGGLANAQIFIGETNKGGGVVFKRGSDGTYMGSVGAVSATENLGVALLMTRGNTSGIVLDQNANIVFNSSRIERMRILSGGYVGIATTTPAVPLSVVGNAAFTGNITVATPTATNHAATKSYVDSMFTGSGQWTTTSTGVFLTNATGRVGIGTATPSVQVELSKSYLGGSNNSMPQIKIVNTNTDTTGYGSNSLLSVKAGAVEGWLTAHDSVTLGSAVDVRIVTNHGFNVWTNDFKRMTILNNGNVGIGTTNPESKLQIGGFNSGQSSPKSTLSLSNASGRAGIVFASKREDASTIQNTGGIFAEASGGWTSKLHFMTNNSWGDPAVNAMTIYGSNVGIGTTSPAVKLEINHTNALTDLTQSAGYALKIKNTAWTANQFTGIEFWNGSSKTVPVSRIVSQMAGSGNGGENLIFQTQSFTSSNPNPLQPTTKMTLTNNGSLGIGVSPSYTLDVLGTGYFSGNVIVATPTANEHATTKSYVDSVGAEKWTKSGNNIYSTVSGNVGIGSTVPAQKLDVNGTVSLTGITTAGSSINYNYALGTNVREWYSTYGYNKSYNRAENDWFTHLLDRGGTISYNRAPTSGDISNIFKANSAYVYWTNVSAGNTVELTVSFSPVQVEAGTAILIQPGSRNMRPRRLKVQTFDLDSGTWITHYDNTGGPDRSDLSGALITMNTRGPANGPNYLQNQLRITVTEAGDSDKAGIFSLSNLIWYERYSNGRMTGYNMSVSGDTGYGDYIFSGKVAVGTTSTPAYSGLTAQLNASGNIRLFGNYISQDGAHEGLYIEGGSNRGFFTEGLTSMKDFHVQNATNAKIHLWDTGASANKKKAVIGFDNGSFWVQSVLDDDSDPGNGGYSWRWTKDANGDVLKQYWDILGSKRLELNGAALSVTDSLGIGTTSPSEEIEVYKFQATTSTAIKVTNQSTSSVAMAEFIASGPSGDLSLSISGTGVAKLYAIGNASALTLGTFNLPRLTILSGGNVGIGTTNPGYKFQVGAAGDGTEARANAWNTLSDARLKTDITKISSPFEILEPMNAYYYHWKDSADKSLHIGVLAQDVELTLPEAVSTDKEGIKSVNYDSLVPVLIDAVKELKTENEKLKDAFCKMYSSDKLCK